MLAPTWSREFPPGVEWVRSADAGAVETIVVCTADHQLRALEAASGQDQWPDPVAGNPGVRWIGRAPGGAPTAYAFDRFVVYALDLGGSGRPEGPPEQRAGGGLLWSAGQWPDTAEMRGDPEFLERIVAAAPTVSGVLVVRGDGRLAELSGRDGRPVWSIRLEPVTTCVLHVRGELACLVSRRPDGAWATLLEPGDGAAEPVRVRLGDELPLWSELTRGGLVALWPQALKLVTRRGELGHVELPPGVRVSAATSALLETPAGAVLVLRCQGGLRAYRLDFRAAPAPLRLVWSDPAEGDGDRAAPDASRTPLVVSIQEGVLIEQGPDYVRLRDIGSGRLLGWLCPRPARSIVVQAVGVAGGSARVLFRRAAGDGDDEERPRDERPALATLPLRPQPATRPSQAEASEGVDVVRLDWSGPVREVCWTRRGIVLVGPRHVSAWVLP